MKLKTIKDNYLVVTKNGSTTNINLAKIQDVTSSVESNPSKLKTLIYWLLGICFLLTIVNFKSNCTEKVVPEELYNTIYYERGFDRYSIQPGGWGTSIYPVFIGEDGRFYYSSYPARFVTLEVLMLLVLVVFVIIQRRKSKYFKENKHCIIFFVPAVGRQKVYVGDYDKTKQVLYTLRGESNKYKLL